MNVLPLKDQRLRYRDNVLHVASLRGLNANAVGKLAGIDPRTMLRILDGQAVSDTTRIRVARALGVSDRSLRMEAPDYFTAAQPGSRYRKDENRAGGRVACVTNRDFVASYQTKSTALGLCRTLQVRRLPPWTRIWRRIAGLCN